MSTPTTGSPTITLFQLHPNRHPVFRQIRLNLTKLTRRGFIFKPRQLFEYDGRCVQSLKRFIAAILYAITNDSCFILINFNE